MGKLVGRDGAAHARPHYYLKSAKLRRVGDTKAAPHRGSGVSLSVCSFEAGSGSHPSRHERHD